TQIPLGSTIDATHGQVTITTTDGTYVFYDGGFTVTQTGATSSYRAPSGRAAAASLTDIKLVGGDAAQCSSKLRSTSSYSAKKKKPKKKRTTAQAGRSAARVSSTSFAIWSINWDSFSNARSSRSRFHSSTPSLRP